MIQQKLYIVISVNTKRLPDAPAARADEKCKQDDNLFAKTAAARTHSGK